jgi:hypothetical protein
MFDLRSQQQQSFTMGASVYCRFFASPSTRGAESFHTIDPWCHGSIVRKRSGGKRPAETTFPPFSVQKGNIGIFSAMAKKTLNIF